MNYLGLDWGKSKIGVALGSDEMKIASPILVLHYKSLDEAVEKLQQIIKEEDIKNIIIGKPVSLSGGEQFSAEFENFVEKIKQLGITVQLEDERLSSKLAQKQQRESGQKGDDDALAASAILQSYFDKSKIQNPEFKGKPKSKI
ncbi:Holliday junction resolvase RuvX [Candidatus Kuenenbacteria bacterium]|nr:Holliday junction resolvase RuvX [Candidatus Kuenenbacteria bacterium]